MNDFIIKLLVSPSFRVFRYSILFMLTFSIGGSQVWFMVDSGMVVTSCQEYFFLCFYVFMFSGGCMLNIYVLTPRLLMENKWIAYFFSVATITLIILVSVIIIQLSFHPPENLVITDINDYYFIIVNIISAFISICLLFVGTATITLFKNWILDQQQSEALESTTMQLELQLLENQINPHFLFNMLNNANIMIKKDPDTAIHIIDKLEDMLRYLMNDSSQEKVYLKDDIAFLNDFLELENTRRDYFNYEISKEGDIDNIQIPPLLFITFVENAIKHNADSRAVSYVKMLFNVTKDELIFICENSIPENPPANQTGGIGLTNIRRRLNLLFNNNYSLELTKTDTTYTVKLRLKL